MNANKIETGKTYIITVGKNTTTVKVTSIDRRVNGQLAYDCMNVNTNKRLTVTDVKRFVKEVKEPQPNKHIEGVKNIIRSMGFGKAKEDAERRESIAKTLAEAGAEPEHVEAAKVAMAVQAADAKRSHDYASGETITLTKTARWTNSTGNGPVRHELPPGTLLTLQTRKPEGWECETVDGTFFFLFEADLPKNAAPETQERGKGGKKKGTISGLDAAAQVLSDSPVPLNVKQITERALALGWAPEGKTPMNTLSAAIQMEIKKKGDASRFAKVDKGLFARK